MYSFPNLEPAHCSMSGSNCCFLTCVSQEASKVIWYYHLFKNFPQFVVIHTVKSFSVVNEAEVDIFLELSCFYYDPVDIGNLISGSSAFSKSSMNIWKFLVHVLLKTSLENFERYFASLMKWVQLCGSLNIHWHCLSLGLEWKLIFFQSCGYCWVFQICLHNECSSFTESSFRIWNSSARIPSPPLAFFIVKLPKLHLTSHSRVFGSRWVITLVWLSGSLRSLLYSFSVYSGYLFLYLLLLLGSYHFCPLLCPSLDEMLPWYL